MPRMTLNEVLDDMSTSFPEPPVTVIFRKDPDGTIFALFPDLESDTAGLYCTCYQHVGQHSGADYVGCIAASKPAKPDEYTDLLAELRSIGYNPVIRQRRSYS